MKKRTWMNVLLASFLATSAGCATLKSAEHKYLMRGSVLEVTDGTATVCLGTEQGAQVGQEFTVYRYIRSTAPGKGGYTRYRVEKVGTVKITEIESHMANTRITAGGIKENDVVELNP